MPFQSERQRRYMWAKHPSIARRWAKEESLLSRARRLKRKRKKKKGS